MDEMKEAEKPDRPEDCCEDGKHIVSYSAGTDREWYECLMCGNRWPITVKIEERENED